MTFTSIGKKFLLLLILLLLAVATVSCTQDKVPDTESPPQESHEETYTLLIYMCASTLESDFGAATSNITELLNAEIDENVNIVVQAGGTGQWKNDFLSSVVTERFVVANKAVETIERIPKTNFGESKTLSDFLDWGVTSYPADHFGLILWDHGGGSLRGVCCDENYTMDCLSLLELETALQDNIAKTNIKFDFVGFDACLMATYETACTVQPYAKTMLASEETEPSGGWDYTTLAENVNKDGFYDAVLTSYAEKCKSKNKQTYTLSAIDLDKIGTVQTALDGLVEDLGGVPLASVVRSAGKALCFGTNKRTVFTDLIDLVGFASAVGNTDVETAIGACIKSVSGEYRQNATGLSIYFPLNSVKEINKYLEVSTSDSYKSFLSSNYTDTSAGQIFIVNGGFDDNGKLKAQVSSDSVRKITKVTYKLFRISTNGDVETVYGMGEDTDVIFDGTNGYTVDFEGRWVTFNGNYINCSVETDNAQYTEYSSPIKVNDALSEMRFVFNKQTRQLKLQGYSPIDSELGVAGRTTDFAVCDRITLMYDDRTEYERNLIGGDSFVYSDMSALAVAYLPVGYYQYNMFFYDSYGNEYRSDTAVVYFDGTKSSIYVITEDEVVYE